MLRNVGSNWVLVLVTIAATYVLTPFLIETLGEEGYGTWTLITSITAYIGLLALGVPMACVRYLAQHVAERDTRMLNTMIGSCAALYLVISALAIVVGALLMRLFGLYDIPATFAAQAPLAFALMVVYVSAGFVGLLPEGILFAHHAFVPRNLVRIGGVRAAPRPHHRRAPVQQPRSSCWPWSRSAVLCSTSARPGSSSAGAIPTSESTLATSAWRWCGGFSRSACTSCC